MRSRTAVLLLSICLLVEAAITAGEYQAGQSAGVMLTLGIMCGLILGLWIINLILWLILWLYEATD